MKKEKRNLPYYVYFSPEQSGAILQRLNLHENSERILFEHLCIFARQTHNPYIDSEDFVLYLLQWAERSNYSAFRIARNVQRHLLDFSDILVRYFFCERKIEEGELLSLTLLEPEIYMLESFYDEQQERLIFADSSLYDFEPYSELFIVSSVDQFKQEVIDETITAKKILKVEFFRSESHIILPYKFINKLNNYALGIVSAFLTNENHAKTVEDIIYRVKPLLQGIELNLAKVERLLKEEDKDSPLFLFYFARELSNQVLRDQKKFLPVYHASRLLERFQLLKEEKQVEEANALKYVEAGKKMEVILHESKEFITKENFLQYYQGYKTEKGDILLFTDMSESEFENAFYRFIAEASQQNDSSSDPLPEVVRIYADGQEFLVHRDNVLPMFEFQLGHAQEELRTYYKELFHTHLLKNQNPLFLKNAESFWQHVERKVNQDYVALSIFLKNPLIVYNSFFLSSTPRADVRRLENYFIANKKSVFKPSAILLNLRREEIYAAAHNMLPYSHKFFLFRLLKNFVSFILSFLGSTNRHGSATDATTVHKQNAGTKDIQKKIHSALDEIEKNICGDTPIPEKMAQLENKWNIKIGEARAHTSEEVILETNAQVRKLSDMIQKLKRFDFSMAQSTFKSIAETIQKRYPEIYNRKALEAYIILTASKTLKKRFRK